MTGPGPSSEAHSEAAPPTRPPAPDADPAAPADIAPNPADVPAAPPPAALAAAPRAQGAAVAPPAIELDAVSCRFGPNWPTRDLLHR